MYPKWVDIYPRWVQKKGGCRTRPFPGLAKARGVATLALSAKGGGPLASVVDHCVVIPTDRTDRAQEIQMAIQHAICDAVDLGATAKG